MFKNLSPRALGFSGTIQSELIELALTYGFRSIDLDIVDFSEQVSDFGLEHSSRLIESAKLRIANFDLPLALDAEEEAYQKDLARLPLMAKLAQDLNCTRALATLPAGSDTLPMNENFELHRKRLAEVGEVLAKHDVQLAVNFIASKTARDKKTHEFIHDLEATLTLLKAVGAENVGLLLDTWQLYASGGSMEDIKTIPAEMIISVQLADAPKEKEISELKDTDRLFPGESGVIDLVGALKILKEVGYEGPVTPKTLRERIKGLGREQAVKIAGERLGEVWTAAGFGGDVVRRAILDDEDLANFESDDSEESEENVASAK
ncbi:Sugar phosphate isomerase/epimerase [Planctomycetales bacterium 10988]|nr:Sugar phosphate isomerase/epimerase [Planctomycetales bacterium 10988]